MKISSIKQEFPIEVSRVPGFVLTIQVSARKEMLDALNSVGVGPAELPNMQKKLLQDAVEACDGIVPGLIVSNLDD